MRCKDRHLPIPNGERRGGESAIVEVLNQLLTLLRYYFFPQRDNASPECNKFSVTSPSDRTLRRVKNRFSLPHNKKTTQKYFR
jgi:hypothetical protein